jgi:hypothetical protein
MRLDTVTKGSEINSDGDNNEERTYCIPSQPYHYSNERGSFICTVILIFSIQNRYRNRRLFKKNFLHIRKKVRLVKLTKNFARISYKRDATTYRNLLTVFF